MPIITLKLGSKLGVIGEVFAMSIAPDLSLTAIDPA
jgi:hypothetical protein